MLVLEEVRDSTPCLASTSFLKRGKRVSSMRFVASAQAHF